MRSGAGAIKRFVAGLPIRWRLTLMSFGLLAVLLAALGGLVSLFEEHTLMGNQAATLRSQARLAAGILRQSSLELPEAGQPLPTVITVVPQQAYLPLGFLVQRLSNASTGVAVLAPDGTVMVSSADFANTESSVSPPAVMASASAITNAFQTIPADDAYIVASDTAGNSQLLALLPIVDEIDQTTVGLLQVSTPTAPFDAAVTSTRLVLALGVFVALLIAAALTLPLMTAGLRPLVEMERASERIAAGALSLRLDEPPTNDEIGQLARSFNSMVAQLEAAFSRQKQFVADVSHELRTPLTALGGELEMLLLGADRGDAEAARRLARGMYAEVARMRRLVEDLLTLTRLDEGRTMLRTGPVAVAPLLQAAYEQAEGLTRGQEIRCEIASDLPEMRADADHVRQIVLNLIDNAIKYTPAPGTITLSARQDGPDWLLIEVKDTGVGISAEALPHVFERFYRADPARTRTGHSAGGAGLGLAIAKGLVEAQGGRIAIESTEGEGTTVALRFPTLPVNVVEAGPSTVGISIPM